MNGIVAPLPVARQAVYPAVRYAMREQPRRSPYRHHARPPGGIDGYLVGLEIFQIVIAQRFGADLYRGQLDSPCLFGILSDYRLYDQLVQALFALGVEK